MDISSLLGALCVPDNEIRRAAEASYEAAKVASPEQVAAELLGAVNSSPEALQPHLKELAAVLLRRLISGSGSSWGSMSPGSQDSIRAALLQSISAGEQDAIRRKVCDALAELAWELLSEDPEAGWPGLLQALMQLVSHAGAFQREMALDVFSRIAECVAAQLEAQLGVLVDVFQARLADELMVRAAAMRALCAFLDAVEESGAGVFQPLLPVMLTAVSDATAMSATAEPQTKEMLEILVELVEYSPRFFRPCVNNFAQFMVALGAAGQQVPQSFRHLAVEWLVSLAEAKPTLARKVVVEPNGGGGTPTPFPRAAMQVCVQMMLEIEEEPGWDTDADDVEDADDVRNVDVGAGALDRLAIALGAKASIPVAFELINEALQREASGAGWVYAHCALHAMCQVVEVGKDTDFAGPMEVQVVACACQLIQHAHPRVRYMALQALGQLLLDHGPGVHHAHHAQIVPSILASLDVGNNPSPRVRCHAAASLINFVDFCDVELLSPYLDATLTAALGAMQAGPRIVQEQAVGIISSASTVMENELSEGHYDLLMPLLQSALAQVPGGEDFRMLKGRILECISLLGVAVSKERFAADVMPIMAAMTGQEGGIDPDDPQKSFILKAWVRIGKALGGDFVPYLAYVMPPLLLAIESSVEQELSDEQVASNETELDSDTECVVQNAEGKLVSVRTSALEEQANAAHMVLLIAESLGPHFFPYVERLSRSLAPLAATSVHDDVRSYCMAALPELVASAARTMAQQFPGDGTLGAGGDARWQPLREILQFFTGRLLEAIGNEGELEALMTGMQSLKACVEHACRADWSEATDTSTALSTARAIQRRDPLVPSKSQPLLADEELSAVSKMLLRTLAESIQRRAVARAEAQTDEDYDEDQEEKDAERGVEEEELHFNISEVLGSLLKTHGARFLPMIAEDWAPKLADLSHEVCLLADRKLASYIWCDVLEYCGEAAAPLLDTSMALLLSGVSSDEPTLRQPCAYGVGVAAVAAPHALAATPWVERSLQHLSASAQKEGAREGEQESATDNVVAAIGSICIELAAHPVVQREGDALWQQYLAYLPLRSDIEESAKVISQLCRLTRSGDLGLLGAQRERLPTVWMLLMGAVGASGSTDQVHRDIAETVRALTSALSAEQMSQLRAGVPPEVAERARTLMASA